MGYYSDMQKKLHAKGGFKHGERVRVKPAYRGKTYATKLRRGGEWILSDFKIANWVLKRPSDYTGYHTQDITAKPYMIERVHVEKEQQKKLIVTTPPTLEPDYIQDALKSDYMFSVSPSSWSTMKNNEMMQHVQHVTVHDAHHSMGGWHNHDTQAVEQNDTVILSPGTVVIINDPDNPKNFKGLWTIIEHGNTSLKYINVAPLFGGVSVLTRTDFITVIPEKDLTIVYLPK